jgi:hypothetical protein
VNELREKATPLHPAQSRNPPALRTFSLKEMVWAMWKSACRTAEWRLYSTKVRGWPSANAHAVVMPFTVRVCVSIAGGRIARPLWVVVDLEVAVGQGDVLFVEGDCALPAAPLGSTNVLGRLVVRLGLLAITGAGLPNKLLLAGDPNSVAFL